MTNKKCTKSTTKYGLYWTTADMQFTNDVCFVEDNTQILLITSNYKSNLPECIAMTTTNYR